MSKYFKNEHGLISRQANSLHSSIPRMADPRGLHQTLTQCGRPWLCGRAAPARGEQRGWLSARAAGPDQSSLSAFSRAFPHKEWVLQTVSCYSLLYSLWSEYLLWALPAFTSSECFKVKYYYYPHFTDEKTDLHKREVQGSRPRSLVNTWWDQAKGTLEEQFQSDGPRTTFVTWLCFIWHTHHF